MVMTLLNLLWGIFCFLLKWVLPVFLILLFLASKPTLMGTCFSQAIILVSRIIKRSPGAPIVQVFAVKAIDVWNLSLDGLEVAVEDGSRSYHIAITKWQIRTAVMQSLKTFFSTVKPLKIRLTGVHLSYASRSKSCRRQVI